MRYYTRPQRELARMATDAGRTPTFRMRMRAYFSSSRNRRETGLHIAALLFSFMLFSWTFATLCAWEVR